MSNELPAHFTPSELAKILGIRISSVPQILWEFLKTGPVEAISNEDALLVYTGQRLMKEVGLQNSRIREICEWLKSQDFMRQANMWWPPDEALCIWIPVSELMADFNRKRQEMRDNAA